MDATAPPILCAESVQRFAEQQMRRLPAGLFEGVECSLAGGMYKSLLSKDAPPPRDLDVWPLHERDEQLLLQRLAPHALQPPEPTRFNTKVIVRDCCAHGMSDGTDASLGPRQQHAHEEQGPGAQLAADAVLVEVVKARGMGLQETVKGFDMALSAIGVHVKDGAVCEVYVHPLAAESVRLRQPLLATTDMSQFPNPAYILATAERVVRYARTLGWPRPEHQLAALRGEFERLVDSGALERGQLLRNYREVSLLQGDRETALQAMGVSSQEWEQATAPAS